MRNKTALNRKLDELLALGIPFYDCMVMKDGVCVFRRQDGFVDLEKQKRPTGQERYRIYSCSKLITCTAALQLLEQGMLRLDDPLDLYLPEFAKMTVATEQGVRPAKNRITLRHLFTMTAGFSYQLTGKWLDDCRAATGGRCPTREVLRCLAGEPLLFEPGHRWEYSLCHDVLAGVVEVISGMPFGAYVKQHIFDPLGMTNSTFSLPPSQWETLCPAYRFDAQVGRVVPYGHQNDYIFGDEYESGGAGGVSTVEDYMAFLEGLRTGKLLKKETVSFFAINQMTDRQRAMPSYWVGAGRGFSLGQQCPTADDPRPDFGWGGAAGAHYFVDLPGRLTAYFGTQVLGYDALQQSRTGLTPIIQQIWAG